MTHVSDCSNIILRLALSRYLQKQLMIMLWSAVLQRYSVFLSHATLEAIITFRSSSILRLDLRNKDYDRERDPLRVSAPRVFHNTFINSGHCSLYIAVILVRW